MEQTSSSGDQQFQSNFSEYWDKYKMLQTDSKDQINALERMQLILSEILQCEKSYEITLRRIAANKHDIGTTFNPNQMQSKSQQDKASIKQSILYHTAVQTLQNFCYNKAEQIRRTSVNPTEKVVQGLSEMLRSQEKLMTQLMSEGSSLVGQMQNLCFSLTNREHKNVKIQQKQRKGESIIAKLIGLDKESKQTKISQSHQDKLVQQQEQMKIDQQTQHTDYLKIVKESQKFRETYSYKLQEIIDSLEKSMRYNIDTIQNSIIEYSNQNLKHSEEVNFYIEKLRKDIQEIALKDCLEIHLSQLPVFNKQKVVEFNNDWIFGGQMNQSASQSNTPQKATNQQPQQLTADIDSETLTNQQKAENDFFQNLQIDINKLILACWDGNKIREDDKKYFRHMVRFNKGQWIFINLLNQFRIKNVHSLSSDQAILSISELLKIVLDEIMGVADTYVAVNCLLLSSTFYFNPASQGGSNSKKFLFELISDHRIWQDIDFWERAITQQIQKDLKSHQDMQNSSEDSTEKSQRYNEVVFAILFSLQQEMLTYNIPKDLIKALVNKICRNTKGFPDQYLNQMLSKIEDYVAKPLQSMTLQSARQFIQDPQNDPLFEEAKKSNRTSTSVHSSNQSDSGRKVSSISSSTQNNEISRTPSPKLSPKADQGSRQNTRFKPNTENQVKDQESEEQKSQFIGQQSKELYDEINDTMNLILENQDDLRDLRPGKQSDDQMTSQNEGERQ